MTETKDTPVMIFAGYKIEMDQKLNFQDFSSHELAEITVRKLIADGKRFSLKKVSENVTQS